MLVRTLNPDLTVLEKSFYDFFDYRQKAFLSCLLLCNGSYFHQSKCGGRSVGRVSECMYDVVCESKGDTYLLSGTVHRWH